MRKWIFKIVCFLRGYHVSNQAQIYVPFCKTCGICLEEYTVKGPR